MTRQLTEVSEKERRKAEHALNQRVMYDKSVDLRIILQKALTSANSLPPPAVRAAFCASSSEVRLCF
jgi:apoptosis antagonizing transcription factor